MVHGDLIGRLWTAGLQIDDGRISEAHALISLRAGAFQLLALRGAFAVNGKLLERVELVPGLVVQLARGVELQVVEVHLPDHVLALEGPGLPRQALPGVASLLPGPRLVAGWRQDALVHTWATGEGVRIQPVGEPRRPLNVGDRFHVDGTELVAVALPLGSAGNEATRRGGSLARPLTVVAHFDTVHILRDGLPAVPLSGKQARLVSELAAVGTSLAWLELARLLWPDEADAPLLRARLDVVLTRIRRRLRARGVRDDLVRADGAGQIELVLYGQDTLQDRT